MELTLIGQFPKPMIKVPDLGIDSVPKFLTRIQKSTEMVIEHLKIPKLMIKLVNGCRIPPNHQS